ncbi:MAG: hypothetical protein WD208_10325 [Dehalococcoidia bacterium]
MVNRTSDEKLNFVLEQIETIVSSEGGTLEVEAAGPDNVRVKYLPGVNEECPECVPTIEQVQQFMDASIGIHAPHIKNVQVVLP